MVPNPAEGSLAGVPVAVKDLIDHESRVTTNGSAFYRETATRTAPCVQRLENAGAVVIGRTGLHEWAFGFSTENPHFGPVRNPWDPATSTGGSSGGSGAAVAAGIVPIAVGTDTGGSVRVPAALCGTYGLKVTHGRVPLEGVFPLVPSIDTVGPLADSVDSIEQSYRAMSGDQETAGLDSLMRIGIPEPWHGNSPTSDEIADEFQWAVAALREEGHQVHPISMPDVVPSPMLWNAIAEEVREVHRQFRSEGQPYGEDVRVRLEDAEAVTEADIRAGRDWQEMIRQRFADAFGTVDFLITPSVPVRSKRIGEDTIDGVHYRSVVSYFSALVNHSLHPAIALPLATDNDPPGSLHVIGPMRSEPKIIAFAHWLEHAGISRFRTAPGKFT